MPWGLSPTTGSTAGGNTATMTLDTDVTGPMTQPDFDASWFILVAGGLVAVTVTSPSTVTFPMPAHAAGVVAVELWLDVD